jgi:capsule polysaccharide export protein KpsE/RkpR
VVAPLATGTVNVTVTVGGVTTATSEDDTYTYRGWIRSRTW